MEIEKVLKEIREELERGIQRNDVLPLDWAMDRIKPIIEKALKSSQKQGGNQDD